MATPTEIRELIDLYVTNFADRASKLDFESAAAWASLAKGRWDMLNAGVMEERARQQGIPWPLPGDPGADDAKGWAGWYGGGYGGTLA